MRATADRAQTTYRFMFFAMEQRLTTPHLEAVDDFSDFCVSSPLITTKVSSVTIE